MSKHYKTSGAILVDAAGCLLLQQRDNLPEILYPGKIGLFGGDLEGNATSRVYRARDTRRDQLLCIGRTVYASHCLRGGTSSRRHDQV
jgi:hypothetical protein